MREPRVIVVLLMLLWSGFAPPIAVARDYYFFNKAGVSREDYLEDRIVCDRLAGGTQSRDYDTVATNAQIWRNPNLSVGQAAAAAGIAGLMMGFLAASERRQLVRQIERICLADKGYRRIAMDKGSFRAIEKLKEASARIDQWFALAATEKTVGKEMYE